MYTEKAEIVRLAGFWMFLGGLACHWRRIGTVTKVVRPLHAKRTRKDPQDKRYHWYPECKPKR